MTPANKYYSRKRTAVLALLLVISWAFARARAQQPQQSGEDVIKIDTALVQVRAVVTNRSGKVVNDLKQDDFEILENGKPQRIGFFSLETISHRATNPSTPLAAASNQSSIASVNAKPQRTIVLFVDTLHLNSSSLVRAKTQLKRFIDEQVSDEDEAAIVTTTNSLGILGQFMKTRPLLKRAVDKIQGFAQSSSFYTPYIAGRVLSEDQQALNVAMQIVTVEDNLRFMPASAIEAYARARAQQIFAEEELKRQNTWQILKAVAGQMAALPGERMIAFMSDGFTLVDRSSGVDNQDLNAATSQAVRAGVVIYSFSPQGLTAPAESSAKQIPLSPEFSRWMSESLMDSQQTLRVVANDTGGEAFLNSNDMVGQMKKMLDANEVYYAISYYPEDRKDQKFRNLKVQVKNHPEYKVRAQRGYQYIEKKVNPIASTPRQKVLQAILAPLPVTTIPVVASASFLDRAGESEQVLLQVHVSGNLEYKKKGDKFDFNGEAVVIVLDHSVKIVGTYPEPLRSDFTAAQLEAAKQHGYLLGERFKLAPGLYQIRVGFRDLNSEQFGTANTWIEVPDVHKKKLTMSSIFLGRESGSTDIGRNRPPELLVGPASFKSGESIFYRFVAYRGDAVRSESDLSFKVELLNGDATVYQGEWQPAASRVIRKDSQRTEIGGLLKTNLEPGFYTLRITVRDGQSKQTAQQAIDFELE